MSESNEKSIEIRGFDHRMVFILLISALSFMGGVLLFAYSFPRWIPLLYAVSLALMQLGFFMSSFAFCRSHDFKRPLAFSAVMTAISLLVSLILVYVVNNMIFGADNAERASSVLSLIFSIAFALIFTSFVISLTMGKTLKLLFVGAFCVLILSLVTLPSAYKLLPVRYEHPFVDKVSETFGIGKVKSNQRLIINADDSHWWGFFNDLASEGRFDDDSINAYVMQYADTEVTDIMFNVFSFVKPQIRRRKSWISEAIYTDRISKTDFLWIILLTEVFRLYIMTKGSIFLPSGLINAMRLGSIHGFQSV